MKNVIKSMTYDLYLIGLCTLSFLSYIGKIDAYILYIFIGLMTLAMLTKRSFFYVFPAPLITFMSF